MSGGNLVIDSAIQRHLLENIKHLDLKVGNEKFTFFGKLPLPVVREDNDFDFLVSIVSDMMLVVGAILPTDLSAPVYLAKSGFKFDPVDPTKVYSSEKFSLTSKDGGRTAVSGAKPIATEYFEMIQRLSAAYSNFFEEKWSILGPVVRLNFERKQISNYYVALFSQNPTVPLVYEFLCAVYDEALDREKEDVIIEVMQLCAFHAQMYPDYLGFHDLLGVCHYNRNEYGAAIRSWNRAKECLESDESGAGGLDESGGEGDADESGDRSGAADSSDDGFKIGTIEKIDSMIASAEVKLHLEIGCSLAASDPGTALKHLQSARPVFSDWWVHSYHMGIAYYTKKDYEQSKKYFERTLELFSGCHQAYERIAEIHRREEDFEKMYEALANSLKINPNNGEVLGKLILVAEKIGKLDKVAKLIKQAKELDHTNDFVVQAEQVVRQNENRRS